LEEISHCLDDEGNFLSEADEEYYIEKQKEFERDYFIPCQNKEEEINHLVSELNTYFICRIQKESDRLRRKWKLP
jgi:hypothetical protein